MRKTVTVPILSSDSDLEEGRTVAETTIMAIKTSDQWATSWCASGKQVLLLKEDTLVQA